MYGDEIKAVLLEEPAWIVGLDPFPRLLKGTQHDQQGYLVLSCPALAESWEETNI